MANPMNAKPERRLGAGRPQDTLTLAALALLLLAAGLWFFSGASAKRRGEQTVKPRSALAEARWTGGPPDSVRQSASAIRLDLNLFSAARAVSSPRNVGSVPGRPEDYLGTKRFPAPPSPTRAQHDALKQAITARLNIAGLRVLLDGPDARGASLGGEQVPVLVITRDLTQTNGVAFLLVRAQLQQTLYALPSGSEASGAAVSGTVAGNEAQYVGARPMPSRGAADTWRWTEKAVLNTVDQFLARRRFEARYGGNEGIGQNAESFAEYLRMSGTPASSGRK